MADEMLSWRIAGSDIANDSGATTIGGFLFKLLKTLLEEEEGFDSKRPFGNSGWLGDLEEAIYSEGGSMERLMSEVKDGLNRDIDPMQQLVETIDQIGKNKSWDAETIAAGLVKAGLVGTGK